MYKFEIAKNFTTIEGVNIYIITIGSDESKMEYLKKSADIKLLNINYLVVSWNGFIDKIIHMLHFIKDIPNDDIICFIDAYDIIVSDTVHNIYKKFINTKCNILFSSELVCFPYINFDKYTKIFNDNIETNFKYLNSGGYIGYKENIYNMLSSKSISDIRELCNIGGDQNFFTQYYLINYNNSKINIKLDYKQSIFQSMCCVNFNDFEFHNGYLYNKYLDTYPSFIHFNGFGDNDIKMAINITNNKLINIIEESLERLIISSNGDVINLPYEQFDKKYIKQK